MSDINLIQEWLKYSQNDLISARHLYEDLHPAVDDAITKLAIENAQIIYDFCAGKIPGVSSVGIAEL